MDALGTVNQQGATARALSGLHQTGGSAGEEGARASAQAAEPLVYLEIRRDDAIDRVIFEYKRVTDGEIVQQWPARQVVEFYQRMEAMVDRADGGAAAGQGAASSRTAVAANAAAGGGANDGGARAGASDGGAAERRSEPAPSGAMVPVSAYA